MVQVKAYTTRVGAGPYPTEIHGDMAEDIRRIGAEYGTTTGRPRRVGWLDIPALRYASRSAQVLIWTPAQVTHLLVLCMMPCMPCSCCEIGAVALHAAAAVLLSSGECCKGSRCVWCRINGLTHINMTKLDVLSELASIKVGLQYKLDGKVIPSVPSEISSLERVEVVYEELPGWQCDISKVSFHHSAANILLRHCYTGAMT